MGESPVQSGLNFGNSIRTVQKIKRDAMVLAQVPSGQAGTEFALTLEQLQLALALHQRLAVNIRDLALQRGAAVVHQRGLCGQ